ncbi:HlyD family efflux transporter periplasmic adaptor subunit [Mesorhizobium sp. M4B.F.Ca.ET.190.01.1.1]|uniref:efflux RND transporter periplasmic adaptor subunit n=1 Tax=unclassified Mesorhizobium TaxID=325217 RepID=UPI001092A2DA|nr:MULTISPECIES: HlyD family efflux transporter periplasmic adaptor subunit [unclassified Mesorhizobium]TGR08217.1 HlyD family efflux transporter periplasmic adaptor subunit [Mesorhizobium sp. M4B.F.Ca.ET.200.01.1.1]TGS17574.1 HlyD family efflux transporter periplasmic adaptor subunit [Mesorhizobium sp. M4B.F.Ca.ET.190.01.1.1]TGT29898.1 HlyD family efflux transporter periplasmic adaptor subunit [Mesorhizobium sp. M4B.F.Ca.ET.172.01.1.1]TJW00916.1 MAG: HlyD family efflux transporter periplasmic 
MHTIWMKRTLGIAALVALAGSAVWFAWQRPIAVDLAVLTKGPMEVTIDDEAKARVRHVYTVSAPIAGKVLRISPPRHIGDQVTKDETVMAVMEPTLPSFHDARTHEELRAALAAADAAVNLAAAEIRRIEAALAFSRTELGRAEALARTEAISLKALDGAKFDVETNEAALASAKAQLEVRRNERDSVAARFGEQSGTTPEPDPDSACCIQLRAPVTGSVLNIIQESEGVVQAGAPLIEIGDPLDLEIVADLLSTDAVRIRQGAPVWIDNWGGPPLQGRVSRVDPAGFTKVSALGIEEQRVHTTIDLTDAPAKWSVLGHDYRVIVHVTIWKADNVLTVPVGALFRLGDDWAVFAVRDGHAQATIIKVGQRDNRTAEVLSGLAAGDRVVLHPSDRVTDGVTVAERDLQ